MSANPNYSNAYQGQSKTAISHRSAQTPFDLELEKEILACIIFSPNCMMSALEMGIKVDWFFDPKTALVAEAIIGRHQRSGETLTSLLVFGEVIALNTKKGVFQDQRDCADFYNDLVITGNTDEFDLHLKYLIEYYIRREVMMQMVEIKNKAGDIQTDVFELINKSIASLQEVIDKVSVSKTVDTADMLANKWATRFYNAKNGVYDGEKYLPSFCFSDFLTSGHQEEDFVILAARPGMGKSALAIVEALKVAESGSSVLFCSYEMSEMQVTNRIMAHYSGISYERIETVRKEAIRKNAERKKALLNPLISQEERESLTNLQIVAEYSEYELQEIEKAKNKLLSLGNKFIIEPNNQTPEELGVRISKYKRMYGLSFVVIDYIQIMNVSIIHQKAIREVQVGDIARKLKGFAKKYKVTILGLAQINRSNESKTDKRPVLSDLRESGSLEQEANTVIMAYRPEYYGLTEDAYGSSLVNITEVICVKNRQGALGTSFLDTSLATNRYTPLGTSLK
ncbi:MAG: hypothetical protein EAY68_07550 [Bacteroidetes bacterium]|nr:MAG: hypothetical protein EAY68_07550 [Bacteroidota bacterium]